MELLHMVSYQRRFKWIAIGLNGAVDVLPFMAPKRTGAGNFAEIVGPIKISQYDDFSKLHSSTVRPVLNDSSAARTILRLFSASSKC